MAVKIIPEKIRQAPWPEIDFWGEEQKRQYVESVLKTFNSKTARQSLNVYDGKLREGSNLFQVLHCNEIGIPTPTLPQLDEMWRYPEARKMIEGRHYVDARDVVLRSKDESYDKSKPITERLIELVGADFPYVIQCLVPKESQDSNYGLVLVPGKSFDSKTTVIEAPDFASENHKRKFKRLNEDYTIDWCDEEEKGRTFYANKLSGASRANLYSDGDLYSDCDYLAGSCDDGRVVSVSPGGARAEDFNHLIEKEKARVEQWKTDRLAEI